MSRIKEFHFEWCDAWHNIDSGYDTILETSESGKVILQCLVNLKPQQINLTDREDMFIHALEECNIRDWNGNGYYNYDCFDGDMWALDVAYDDVVVRARGMNGYPLEFLDFVKMLCSRWGLKDSSIKKGIEPWIKQVKKGTVVEKLSDYELSMPSYM